jgi:carboxymethylenebutenolidase
MGGSKFTKLKAADGHKFDCWIEHALGGRKGGIVVLQEIFGVTDQLEGVAARYAGLGYEVAIPALFDRSEKGTVLPFDQGPKGVI